MPAFDTVSIAGPTNPVGRPNIGLWPVWTGPSAPVGRPNTGLWPVWTGRRRKAAESAGRVWLLSGRRLRACGMAEQQRRQAARGDEQLAGREGGEGGATDFV